MPPSLGKRTAIALAALACLACLVVMCVAFARDNAAKPRLSPEEKLKKIHKSLQFRHGSLDAEYPEQLMAVAHIEPRDVVLEIGGNIGRNSCVIASILKDSSHLVVIESDPDSARKLVENRDANGFRFAVENCAISAVPLVQNEWNTRPAASGAPEGDGWKPVNTMTWSEVRAKHADKRFGVLVADCEGALFGILTDEPDFLETFRLIIIENDFRDLEHKRFVDSEFERFGFRNVHREAGGFGPCQDRFYEVWRR